MRFMDAGGQTAEEELRIADLSSEICRD
jgi:hypothetical protein